MFSPSFPTYTRGAMTIEGYREIIGDDARSTTSPGRSADPVRLREHLARRSSSTWRRQFSGFTGPAARAARRLYFQQWLYGTEKPTMTPDDFSAPEPEPAVQSGAGSSTCSIERGEAVGADLDHDGVHPDVVLGGREADRHLGAEALQRLLPADPEHARPRAGHADVGDERGARAGAPGRRRSARGCGCRRRPPARPSRCQPIATFSEVTSAWKSTKNASASPLEALEQRVGLGERRARRAQLDLADQVDHADPRPRRPRRSCGRGRGCRS